MSTTVFKIVVQDFLGDPSKIFKSMLVTEKECKEIGRSCKFKVSHSGITKNHRKTIYFFPLSIGQIIIAISPVILGLNSGFCFVSYFGKILSFRTDCSEVIFQYGVSTSVSFFNQFFKSRTELNSGYDSIRLCRYSLKESSLLALDFLKIPGCERGKLRYLRMVFQSLPICRERELMFTFPSFISCFCAISWSIRFSSSVNMNDTRVTEPWCRTGEFIPP